MMASIVRSEIISDVKQADGRRYVTEEQEDDQGVVYHLTSLIAESDDAETRKTNHSAHLLDTLRDSEVDSNVGDVLARGSLATITFVYSTVSDNIAALREAYRYSNGVTSVMIADFLNSLTDAQLRAIFNRTLAQVNTLRTNKLAPAAALATQLRAILGE